MAVVDVLLVPQGIPFELCPLNAQHNSMLKTGHNNIK